MGLVNKIFGPIISRLNSNSPTTRRTRGGRLQFSRSGLEAAKTTDILADFMGLSRSIDSELSNLRKIQARSRQLCLNDSYSRKFIKMVRNNVVGPSGIRMQMKIRDDDGSLDTMANNIIETAWRQWGKVGTCTVDGRLSWIDVQKLIIETCARDGEVLIRKVFRPQSKFGFELQILETDHLDFNKNQNFNDGKIRYGIESDVWDRPRAYWLFPSHPGSLIPDSTVHQSHPIPADEIIHLYIVERPGQTRGIPWMATAIKNLHMLDKYGEAEAVAARVAAAKMGIIETDPGETEFQGDDQDADGNRIDEVEPGSWHFLDPGQSMKTFDPQHPNGNFGGFVKAMLRGIAAGLDVSYNSLANDLERVNFSSIRSGDLKERDAWKDLQKFMIENFNGKIFSGPGNNFLLAGFTVGAFSPLPENKFDKFDTATWHPRGWQWVDPQKEVKANMDAIAAGLKTRTECLAERGIDFEEHLDQIKSELQLAEDKGVNLDLIPMLSNEQPTNEDDEDDDQTNND